MRSTLPTEVPPYLWTISATISDGAEHQRGVGAAEAERVGQRRADLHVARRIRHEVEIALRILLEQVRRGWCNLVAQRQRGEHRLDAARGAEQVPRHRLGRRHCEPVRMV